VSDDVSDDGVGESSSKRARATDGSALARGSVPPSLVLHVRSLPTFTTEAELTALLAPYGTVDRVLIMQNNHQALVQMSSMDGAQSIVNQSATPPGFSIRGRQVFFQFSNRKEIVKPQNHTAGGGSNHAQQMQTQGGFGGMGMGGGSDGHAPNRIILISVSNVRVPVTLDHIHQICKPSGGVLKIITFNKGQQFKALVEFASLESAVHAKSTLEGKEMFQGCNTVNVSFSSQTELKVTQSGPRARDFQAEGNVTGGTAPTASSGSSAGATNAAAAAATNPYGMMAGFGFPPHMMHAAMQQQGNPYAHMAAQMGYGMPYAMAGGAQNPFAAGVSASTASGSSTSGQGSVLLVSNLPQIPDITPDALFALFGQYGDVHRVKILYKERDKALIQFATAQGCALAIQHLNHATLMEKQLNVTLSKHSEISVPKTDHDESNPSASSSSASTLTQDYTNSRSHRFRNKPPNLKNIHPPSQVLHVAGIPEGTNEETLKSIFGPTAEVQLFKTDSKMAYVMLPSVSDAILTLMRTHNHRLQGKHLRVSFSAKDVAQFQQSLQRDKEQATQRQHTQPQQHIAVSSSAAEHDHDHARHRGDDDDNEREHEVEEGEIGADGDGDGYDENGVQRMDEESAE